MVHSIYYALVLTHTYVDTQTDSCLLHARRVRRAICLLILFASDIILHTPYPCTTVKIDAVPEIHNDVTR